MARKRNPASGSETLVWTIGGAVALYLAYTNNLLSAIGMPYTSGAVTTTAKTTTAATTTNNPIVANTVQPLGTVVNSQADINAQAQSNLAYIIPSTSAVSQAPNGYVMMAATDTSVAPAGVFYLRNDIATKMIGIDQLAAKASGGAVPSMNDLAMPQYAAQNPQQVLTATGMSGFGSLGGW